MITVDFEKERKIFATQLFRIMELRGVKAKELADELGVGVSTIYFWSRHQGFPRVELLIALSRCLKAPIDAFFDEDWKDETNRRRSTKRDPGRSRGYNETH